MILSHLPGLAVGFHRVGPLALHLGVLLTVSGLLGLMTVLLAPTAPLGRQAAAVALAAGCISTRFVVQGYDAVGYTVAGITLGLALIAVLAVEDAALRERVVGGLIALAILHYSYVGLALGLPLCAAWLLARRHPIRATRAFVVANQILALVLVLLVTSMATHPELTLARAYDVVAGVGSVHIAARSRRDGPPSGARSTRCHETPAHRHMAPDYAPEEVSLLERFAGKPPPTAEHSWALRCSSWRSRIPRRSRSAEGPLPALPPRLSAAELRPRQGASRSARGGRHEVVPLRYDDPCRPSQSAGERAAPWAMLLDGG